MDLRRVVRIEARDRELQSVPLDAILQRVERQNDTVELLAVDDCLRQSEQRGSMSMLERAQSIDAPPGHSRPRQVQSTTQKQKNQEDGKSRGGMAERTAFLMLSTRIDHTTSTYNHKQSLTNIPGQQVMSGLSYLVSLHALPGRQVHEAPLLFRHQQDVLVRQDQDTVIGNLEMVLKAQAISFKSAPVNSASATTYVVVLSIAQSWAVRAALLVHRLQVLLLVHTHGVEHILAVRSRLIPLLDHAASVDDPPHPDLLRVRVAQRVGEQVPERPSQVRGQIHTERRTTGAGLYHTLPEP